MGEGGEKKVEETNKGGEEKKPKEDTKEKKEEPKAEKPAEEKKDDQKTEESKDAKEADTKESKEPPPPQDIVLRVYMHCEGCARKVRRCLRGFEGVEDVLTDCKTHKVVVKGEKADPLKVLDRVQRKSHRQVDLLSPIPKPPAEEPKKDEEKKEEAKPEEKKEEPPVIIVVLKVHMHCEACAQEIRKRILRMKGVQAADPDLKSSLVTVKGIFDPPKLVEYVYKRTGKHAVIVKQEPEKKEEEEKGKEEKEEKKGEEKDKGGEGGGDKKEEGEAKAETGGGGAAAAAAAGEEETKVEFIKNEFQYYNIPYPPYRYAAYATEHVYAPQIFSDENPNACSVM